MYLMNHPQRPNSARRNSGFTLVELMFTLTILAILMSLAVPSFNQTLASIRLSSTTNDLNAALSQAKSDAIRLGKRVTICASTDSTTCANTTTWSQGWITFVDGTRTTGVLSVDDGEQVTAVAQAAHDSLRISANTPYVTFGSDGRPRDLNNAFLFGTLRICSTSGAVADNKRNRDLIFSAIGRVRIDATKVIDYSCPNPPAN
jgi:type IV fimbrial biogenesis protein FimT